MNPTKTGGELRCSGRVGSSWSHGYVPLVVNTSRSFPRSRLITRFVSRLTQRVSLVDQELPTLPLYNTSYLLERIISVYCTKDCVIVHAPLIFNFLQTTRNNNDFRYLSGNIGIYCKRENEFTYAWVGWPLWNISDTNDHGYVPQLVNSPR
jgi:hypothetical protein